MAGNFQPQMAGMTANQMMAQMQQQEQNAQIAPYHQQILQSIQQNTPPMQSGWQGGVLMAERFGHVSQVISSLRLVGMNHQQQPDLAKIVNIGINFEKQAFEESPDKPTYTNRIQSKLRELTMKRNENMAVTQREVNNQSHAQQAQRMQAEMQMQASQSQQHHMNMLQNGIQGQVARPGQQPGQQGFHHLQHQMQVSPLPQQQPHQMPVNINGAPQPNGQALSQFQMMQQQQQRQLQQQQQQGGVRPQSIQLTPQEMQNVNQIALNRIQQLTEQQKVQIRMEVQNKFPQMIQQAQGSGQDVVFIFFRNQVRSQMMQTKMRQAAAQQQNANNAGPSSVPMQPQRSGNPNPQQPAAGNPNFDGNFLGNTELINQQHQAGMIAQADGQVVVPASNPQRISTPQGHGGIPGQPNPASNPRQTPNQAQQQAQQQQQEQQQRQQQQQQQQFFNPQQAQGQRLSHAAAQSQQQAAAAAAASAAQNRMRDAVKMQQHQQLSLQGQRGGLGEIPGPQQSPAMPLNTLNTPLRPPGQQPLHTENPQMGQPTNMGGNFVGGLDPRFNQQNAPMQRPGGLGTPMNPNMRFPPNMPPEQRQQLSRLSTDEAAKFMKQWQESNAGNPGMPNPMNGQGMRPGQQMPQNMGFVAQAMVNQPNGTGPQQLPPGMDQQQFAARMAQMQQQQRQMPPIPPQLMQKMDSMVFPRQMINALSINLPVPQDVQNWAQLKQWVVQNNMSPQAVEQLKMLQTMHFKQLSQRGGPQPPPNGQQPPMSQMVPPGMQAPVAPMVMQQPPPNQVGNVGIPMISDQEVQATRQRLMLQGAAQASSWSDDQIRVVLMKNRASRTPGGLTPQQQQQMQQQQQQRMQAQMAQMQHNPQTQQQPQQQPQQQQQQANQQSAAQRGAALFQPAQQARPGSSQAGTSQPSQAPAETAAVKRENKQNQTARTETQNPSPGTASKGLKRSNSDDVVEVPNPNTQPRASLQQPSRNGQQPQQLNQVRSFPTQEQLNAMPPDKRKQFEHMIRSAQTAQRSARYKLIQNEENENFQRQAHSEVQNTPDQKNMLIMEFMSLTTTVRQVSNILERWFAQTGDEDRLRKFLQMSKTLQHQFVDKDMKQPKSSFSVRPQELAMLHSLMKMMIGDLVQKNPSLIKKNWQEPPTAQLNASNLQQHQKQQQALSQQQALKQLSHQRSGSRNNVPAAPTTAHAPFQFGASAGSPQGNPVYSDKPPSTTRDNIQLPKNKKQKMGSGNVSASTSPQIPRTSSPSAKRPQATVVPKVEPQVKTFACPEQDCDANFVTAEDLKKHNEEQHIKPLGDPAKFAMDALADLLGLDSNGQPIVQPANPQTVENPAPKMEMSASAQGQTPKIKPDPSMVSSSMARQMSAPAGKPKQAQSSPAQQIANTPGKLAVNKSAHEQQTTDDPWAAAGIDPNLLMNTFEPLSSNFDAWRSITPNDTPESSKDGISEPNSDISDGVDLSISLDMFDSSWDPFPGGDVHYNFSNMNFDDDVFMGGESGTANHTFSWDDIPVPTPGKMPDNMSSFYEMSTE